MNAIPRIAPAPLPVFDTLATSLAAWRDWAECLRLHLNRRLFLGLISFESHLAHYRPGDFYRTHVDALGGEANRVVSLVCYLNPGWIEGDGRDQAAASSSKRFTVLRLRAVIATPRKARSRLFASFERPKPSGVCR